MKLPIILWYKLLFLIYCQAIDKLTLVAPDKYDIRLNENDQRIASMINEIENYISTVIQKREDQLDYQINSLRKELGTDNVYSMTSKDLWKLIYEYIKENLENFLKGRSLSIKLHMRYSFCT